MATHVRMMDGELEVACEHCREYVPVEYEIDICEQCGMAVCHEDTCYLKGCSCMYLARILLPEEHAAMWAEWCADGDDDYDTLREKLFRDVAAARAAGLSRIPTFESLRAASVVAA